LLERGEKRQTFEWGKPRNRNWARKQVYWPGWGHYAFNRGKREKKKPRRDGQNKGVFAKKNRPVRRNGGSRKKLSNGHGMTEVTVKTGENCWDGAC